MILDLCVLPYNLYILQYTDLSLCFIQQNPFMTFNHNTNTHIKFPTLKTREHCILHLSLIFVLKVMDNTKSVYLFDYDRMTHRQTRTDTRCMPLYGLPNPEKASLHQKSLHDGSGNLSFYLCKADNIFCRQTPSSNGDFHCSCKHVIINLWQLYQSNFHLSCTDTIFRKLPNLKSDYR